MNTATPLSPLPPLAPGLPLLGSIGRLSRQGMLDFVVEQWRELGDVFRIHVGPKTMVVVAHPEGVERVLASNRENYVKAATYDNMRLLTGNGLLTLEGGAWLKRRRLEQPAFHRESIRKLIATMVKVSEAGLARWRREMPAGGTVDAHHEMMRLTLEIVGETLFGQSLEEQSTSVSSHAFGEALSLISARGNTGFSLPMALPTPKNLRLRRALRTLDEVTFKIIHAARSGGEAGAPHSLLGMLLAARDADTGEALNDQELRNEVITLFLAGHETTALLLTWGFTLLARNPEVVVRMRAEVDAVLEGRVPTPEDLPKLTYLRQVIDEILRLRSPTWAVARDVVKDDVIQGFRARAGDVVLPVSYLVHRHPDFWPDPERFDPDRFSAESAKGRNQWSYFPFSLGPRMCIGNVFALTETQVILALLLQQADFNVLGEAPNPKAEVTMRPDGPVQLSVRWRAGTA